MAGTGMLILLTSLFLFLHVDILYLLTGLAWLGLHWLSEHENEGEREM
jgi:hypothetical protein